MQYAHTLKWIKWTDCREFEKKKILLTFGIPISPSPTVIPLSVSSICQLYNRCILLESSLVIKCDTSPKLFLLKGDGNGSTLPYNFNGNTLFIMRKYWKKFHRDIRLYSNDLTVNLSYPEGLWKNAFRKEWNIYIETNRGFLYILKKSACFSKIFSPCERKNVNSIYNSSLVALFDVILLFHSLFYGVFPLIVL